MFPIRAAAITCLVAAIISNASVFAQEATSRIVGGQDIPINRAPYAIQIRLSGQLWCGGTLVSSQYVVTAAHCFPTGSSNAAKAIVVGGVSGIYEKGVARRIIGVILHPEYTPPTMHSDAAVIKLDQPMIGNNIIPIGLCSRDVIEHEILSVYGWGRVADDGPMSETLRMVRMPVRSMAICYNEFNWYVSKNMFCGSGLEPTGHCSGDSGGPAIFANELCGIIAFGYKCGELGYTSAFTNVYKVRSFIENAMRQ